MYDIVLCPDCAKKLSGTHKPYEGFYTMEVKMCEQCKLNEGKPYQKKDKEK